MWQIHTMEYYSAIKRNELLTHATQVNLEDILLSETSQSQKGQILWDSIYMRYLE